MYEQRIPLYEELERMTDSKVLVYVTGDRRGLPGLINHDVYNLFTYHLDKMYGRFTEKPHRITLLLYTTGGAVLAAWSLANLLLQFSDEYDVIVPNKALSAGTLLCLGAREVIMTKQATLGPVDPSVPCDDDGAKWIGVEAVNGFIELARREIGVSGRNTATVLEALAGEIDPSVLGVVYRTRAQIKMLARQLLLRRSEGHGRPRNAVRALRNRRRLRRIIQFLCDESGSHDYRIHRNEARRLGLQIGDSPQPDLYAVIRAIYEDIASELELDTPLVWAQELGSALTRPYHWRSSLLESLYDGCHAYVFEGELVRLQSTTPQQGAGVVDAVADFEGWRHLREARDESA